MKKIFNLIKRFILGAFVLYGYNLIAASFNMVIPINLITISLVAFLGIPALFVLILFLIVVF